MSEVTERVSSLPITQQLGLWVILRMPDATSPIFCFKSSKFAQSIRRFVVPTLINSSVDYGKFTGGVLSGLLRNGLLRRLSGGRDKIWTLSDEVRDEIEEFKEKLLETKTYWI